MIITTIIRTIVFYYATWPSFFVLIKVFFSNRAKNLGKYPEASSFSNYSYYISYSNGISDNASSSFIEPSVGIVYS